MGTPILKVRNLGKRINAPGGELTILDNLSLTVIAGASVAIRGVSGSGKSTLLGLLAGLDTPGSGSVQLDGTDLFSLDEDGRAALRARLLGFVFQSFQLLPAFTALENVMLPLELARRERPREAAVKILHRVGLAERLHHTPVQLSGGEQQRVAIARAFAARPKLLLADEPTGNLDTQSGEHIAELLFELNREQGTTLILVTHDYNLASRCDRILELEGGALATAEEPSESHGLCPG